MSEKVLIVDDECGLLKVMSRLAESDGWDVRAVSVSGNALDAFLEFRPDVIVVDMVMPGMDGIDVLNELLLTGIPARIVLISGFGPGLMHRAAGIADFHGVGGVTALEKPFRRAQFLAALQGGERLVARAATG